MQYNHISLGSGSGSVFFHQLDPQHCCSVVKNLEKKFQLLLLYMYLYNIYNIHNPKYIFEAKWPIHFFNCHYNEMLPLCRIQFLVWLGMYRYIISFAIIHNCVWSFFYISLLVGMIYTPVFFISIDNLDKLQIETKLIASEIYCLGL